MNGDFTAIRNYLEKLLNRTANNQSALFETQTVSTEAVTAPITTVPPHHRYSIIRDSDHLTIDEYGAEVTFDAPTYGLSNTATQEMIFRTRERQGHFPGHQSQAGTEFQVVTAIPDDQFMPSGATLETGYGGLENSTLSGVPHTKAGQAGEPDKDGLFLHLEEDVAEARRYRDGAVAQSIDHTDWDFDPFTKDAFQYAATDYAGVLWTFNLGAGWAKLWFKLARQDESDSVFRRALTMADAGETLLDVWDMPVSTAVTTDGTAVDWSHGPMHFWNRGNENLRERTKVAVYRDPSISATFDADGKALSAPTVVAVYRLHEDRTEVLTELDTVEIRSPNTDARAEIRKVHRDFLDFGAVNPDDDSNWIAPDNQRVADTALEELDVAVGTVSLNTHSDDDGQTKPRGKQGPVAYTESGGGLSGSPEARGSGETLMSELDYAVVMAWVADATKDPAVIQPFSRQRW